MDKDKNKGLADNQDGEFILNESGTSVTIDPDIDFGEDENGTESEDETSEAQDNQAEVKKDER